MSEYTFVADTCNSTAWSGARRFLKRTDAHLVLVQEHHLAPERIADASAWALRNGWHSLFLPAEKGIGSGWRAGVAVFARPHVGLSVPHSGPTEVVPSRVLAASIEPPGFRRTAVLCAYLEDGKGMGHANLRHMEAIGACLAAQGDHVPCIVGGDWQSPPDVTAATGFASQASLTLVATLDPRGTHRDVRKASELDYFFLSNDLAMGLDRVEVVEGAGVRPHVPVRLVFRPRLASTRALHVRCPPQLPTKRMIGPIRRPPDYTNLAQRARRLAARAADASDPCGDGFAHDFARLYSDWADLAETELVEATGANYFGEHKRLGLRGKAPVLNWRSILAERPPSDSDGEQVQWRDLAAKAVDIQRALHHLLATAPDGYWDGMGEDHDGDDADDSFDDGDVADPITHIHAAVVIFREIRREFDAVALDVPPTSLIHRLGDIVFNASNVARSLEEAITGGNHHEAARARDQVGNLLQLLGGARADINVGVSNASERAKAAGVEAWKRWVAHNIEVGAKNAHKYLALPEEWQPTTMPTADNILTSNPTRLLESYRNKYDQIWNGGRDGGDGREVPPGEASSFSRPHVQPWHDVGRREAYPRPSPAELRDASSSFKEATLVAYDGIAMRHYALLTDDSLDVLADMVLVIEYLGYLPQQLQFAVMPLIGKARGGHRAIASLVSLFRLWTHCGGRRLGGGRPRTIAPTSRRARGVARRTPSGVRLPARRLPSVSAAMRPRCCGI